MNKKFFIQNEISEINYIPFLDIMLVLLVILIILSSSIMFSAININVPNASTENPINDNNFIIISIDEKQEYYLNDELCKSIESLLTKMQEFSQNEKIYIKGDKNLPYEKIIDLLDIIKQNGYQKISLVVKK